MEDFLQNVIKESGGTLPIRSSSQEAYDLLVSQTNVFRTPSYELRSICFRPIKLCIESKKSKLLALGISGLTKLIRDERFQTGCEPEDDSLWLPSQLLHATSSMLTHCEDTQVHILRCILSMACASSWALNGRLVMLLIGRCGEAYETGSQAVRAAAQAAASQTLTAFCTFLDEECQEILQQQMKHKNSGSSAEMVYNKTSAVACFNEAIPVMQYLCSKLEEMKTITKSNDMVVFLLECLLTLISTLPTTVHANHHFTTFLWQRFCPALLGLLGTPGDLNATSQGLLSTQQSKIVYSIGIQVVRLVGRERALRPVLEALFHRILLLPPPSKRLEPLRAAKELLRSSGRLADLLLLTDAPSYRHAGDDMAIIRLIMDSIEESAQYSDVNVLLASVECVCALLTSLEALCSGDGLNQEGVELANQRYTNLEQADYTGPLTYQSLARLPKPYRDVVANLKYQSDSDSSSGIEGGLVEIGNGTDTDQNSGATEGPEDYEEEGTQSDEGGGDDDSIMDDESFLTNQQLQKIHHHIPKSLHLGRTGTEECNTDMERHNARHFIKTLQNILLPNLLLLRSSVQIDEVLQEFASKCCQHNAAQAQNYELVSSIMNADGIYLATYSALLLNLRLIRNGHYRQPNTTTDNTNSNSTQIMTENQFVDEIHGSGVLVYISATWLCEVYQNILAKSLLELAGYDPKTIHQPALINLLTDMGGLCPSHYLTDWQKLQRLQKTPMEMTSEIEAGIKLARRVLTCCWSSVVSVLGTPLGSQIPCSSATDGNGSTLSRLVERRSRQKHRQRLRDDVMTACLEGLQKAASLSNILKLQVRSGNILSLLSQSACKPHMQPKIMAAHALSLDVLISKGLDLAAHSADACWPHVFSACVSVARLEHALFSRTGSAQLLMVAQNSQNQVTSSTYVNGHDANTTTKSIDEETVDVYNFLQTPHSQKLLLLHHHHPSPDHTTVSEIVERSGVLNHAGLLSGVQAAKICFVLSSKADELFHSAAMQLALPALCEFLKELCKASHSQLFASETTLLDTQCSSDHKQRWWHKKHPSQIGKPVLGSLLLNRVGEVTLKCIKSGRPLIHTMRVWSMVGPHFMQAACHKDRAISKKAIACIHDTINILLNETVELSHFNFNEALFKPFENLSLELTEEQDEVKDQIIACLCEFVESNRTEIGSGWRPLFSTLRVSSLMNSKSNSSCGILDIFYIFLQTDNTLVFANAALDYILCLLSHIKDVDTSDTSSTESASQCLKLLENCSSILGMMYNMPKCPKFNMTHRMSIETAPQLVEPIPEQDFNMFRFTLSEQLCGSDIDDDFSYALLALQEASQLKTLTEMDAHNGKTGCLKVWFILLEGLSTIAPNGNLHVLDTSISILRHLRTQQHLHFGFYCMNHLLLPMLQIWLRKLCPNGYMPSSEAFSHFKHAVGLVSDLVVEYIQNTSNRSSHSMLNLALKQLLLVLIECVNEPIEEVARLGASCIRHLILQLGQQHHLTELQWEILATAMHRACAVTLQALKQITLAFKPHSDSFYGDLATVKIAARKDINITANETARMAELSQQVFLSQVTSPNAVLSSDDRSYVFLLYPFDMDHYTVRVPYRNLVLGILTHQILTQTISSTLLQNLHHVTPILKILQINSNPSSSLRGILTHVNAKHIQILLKCLEMSQKCAQDFDLRPGLKFLTQKVGNLPRAANLYTQANTSEVVQIIVLIELCLDGIEKYTISACDIQHFLARNTAESKGCTLYTDLDYVKEFIVKLRKKWENLCESYVYLMVATYSDEEEEEEEEIDEHDANKTPNRVRKCRRNSGSSSESCGSYLEKEILPNVDGKSMDIDLSPKLTSTHNNQEVSGSTDDETNEQAAHVKLNQSPNPNEDKPGRVIKYDTNTLLQMNLKGSTFKCSLYGLDSTLGQPLETNSARLNPFTEAVNKNTLPPPEIQQQRSMSIHKDAEAFRVTRIETMEACLELLNSLPSSRLVPLAPILKDGAVMLFNCSGKLAKTKIAVEHLLQEMSVNHSM